MDLDRLLGNAPAFIDWSKVSLMPDPPEVGANTLVYGAFDPEVSKHNGGYLLSCRLADPWTDTVRPWATSSFEAARLWKLSEKLLEFNSRCPLIPDIRFSPDECIKTVRDYHDFLKDMDLPDTEQCKNDDEDVKTLQMVSENPDICDEMPCHAVGLAQGQEESPIFLLDTKFGVIHEW
ncbi:oxidoreductase [Colletotrichum asianum]